MANWARKRLGQHFLIDPSVARRLLEALQLNPHSDVVVEIGPGKGALTSLLAKLAHRVVAVEVDEHLATELRQRFADDENITIVRQDFLRSDLSDYVLPGNRLRVLGNIPYAITSEIVLKLLERANRSLLWDATLMVQREVAERIVAAPGSKRYGVLSVFSQVFARPQILFAVSPRAFRPRPKVASAVVRWTDFHQPPYEVKNEEIFRRLVRVAFSQRRKKLHNALAGLGARVKELLAEAGFDLERRAEDISPREWVQMAHVLSGKTGTEFPGGLK